MPLNPPPIQEFIAAGAYTSPIWVRWFSLLAKAVDTLIAGDAPVVAAGNAQMWLAKGSGTKDGQAYNQGDVLMTSNVGGTSKTILLMDYS